MSLPPFAPFPDVKSRQTISAEDWAAFLDSWTTLADLYLGLDDQHFHSSASDDSSVTKFITSFYHELAISDSWATQVPQLRKKCFLLLHRILSGDQVPVSLLNWSVLADACRCLSKSTQFRALLDSLWRRKAAAIETSLQLAKNSLIRNLETKRPEEAEGTLNRIAPLLKTCSDAGTYMLTGSDFLDSLCNAYPKTSEPFQQKLTATAYFGLITLLEGPKPTFSVLSDHLYSLKANGEQLSKSGTSHKSLIADLVTNTPLLHKIREKASVPEATRLKNFAASLGAFQQPSVARPKRRVKRKIDKGKEKAAESSYGHGVSMDIHVHRMSMISQIQDLFPDLGSAFVAKLLHEYSDNVENVISHLLEDSLPPHLADADRSEQL